jgi:uncharacterized protein DUF6281
MRRIVTAACLALACAGCSSGATDSSAGPARCPSRITWQGTVYYAAELRSRLPATLTLGTGGRPTCADVNGGEAGASSTVEVRRVAGVDPTIAVAINGEPEVAYLARAYFLRLQDGRTDARLRKLVPQLIPPA